MQGAVRRPFFVCALLRRTPVRISQLGKDTFDIPSSKIALTSSPSKLRSDLVGEDVNKDYTECLDGSIKLSNRLRRGYSYEIIRAKTLYAKYACKVGSGMTYASPVGASAAAILTPETVEYVSLIPTLIEIAGSGGLD